MKPKHGLSSSTTVYRGGCPMSPEGEDETTSATDGTLKVICSYTLCPHSVSTPMISGCSFFDLAAFAGPTQMSSRSRTFCLITGGKPGNEASEGSRPSGTVKLIFFEEQLPSRLIISPWPCFSTQNMDALLKPVHATK